eukprot:6181828-Pleurochrysis_carterae.AAC.6
MQRSCASAWGARLGGARLADPRLLARVDAVVSVEAPARGEALAAVWPRARVPFGAARALGLRLAQRGGGRERCS